jgi:hypothetical protein
MKKKLFLMAFSAIMSHLYAQERQSYWGIIAESEIKVRNERTIIPQKYQTFHVSAETLKNLLFSAPSEDQVNLRNSPVIIDLPLPDGTIQRFKVVQAAIMAPELAAQFPNIKTFNITGVDDPQANGKLDWNDFGFHGMIRKPSGDVFIDPYSRNNTSDYISYYTTDFKKDTRDILPEVGVRVNGQLKKKDGLGATERKAMAMICSGNQLRKYRLAVACTGEYAQAATGKISPTTSEILSAVTTTMNRVDGIYETEAAIRLVLVANETSILFNNPSSDPFDGNDDADILIDESQTQVTKIIGSANFDIGHTFSTGAGGKAALGCVCDNNTKAQGVTGKSKPVGDPYDVDYVAHEFGHQFSGNHTFAADTDNCEPINGSPDTAVEPGSGVTIMAYAGICGAVNDLDPHSIPYFHTISFDEIMDYSNASTGNNCPAKTSTGNNAPTVTTPASFTIPFSTPFTLAGSANDPDGDSLTYSWEEVDANYGHDWNSGSKPFFRSYNPVISPSRTFPLPSIVLAGPAAYQATKGEYLPSNAQTLKFRLTARDNKMGGGGVCYGSTSVIVANTGPFQVSYPSATSITWPGSSSQTVTWDVNKTNTSPVNCTNVNILISLDNGATYTVVLANTPNDGAQAIAVPNVSVTKNTCRIKVEAAGNIFFDISDNNFTITSTVGISDLSLANTLDVQLIPNPAQDEVQISVYGLNKNKTTRLAVYDMIGNNLMHDSYTGKEQITQNYELSNLSKGVYIIEIANDQQRSVSKLVKQ